MPAACEEIAAADLRAWPERRFHPRGLYAASRATGHGIAWFAQVNIPPDAFPGAHVWPTYGCWFLQPDGASTPPLHHGEYEIHLSQLVGVVRGGTLVFHRYSIARFVEPGGRVLDWPTSIDGRPGRVIEAWDDFLLVRLERTGLYLVPWTADGAALARRVELMSPIDDTVPRLERVDLEGVCRTGNQLVWVAQRIAGGYAGSDLHVHDVATSRTRVHRLAHRDGPQLLGCDANVAVVGRRHSSGGSIAIALDTGMMVAGDTEMLRRDGWL
jgi:hypothetical protein